MGELTCTFQEFKQRGKELMDAAPSLDEDGLENAIKMFNLSYLNMEGTSNEEYQASIALRLTLNKVDELRPGAVYGIRQGVVA